MPHTNAHEFALYSDALSIAAQSPDRELVITDRDTVHRIERVLRLRPCDQVTLFNRHIHLRATPTTVTADRIIVQIQDPSPNQPVTPALILGLPLLKQEHREHAIYSATELGVTHVQLLATEKSRHDVPSARSKTRFERVMIAAAEQSKNFVLPHIITPTSLSLWIDQLNTDARILFDGDGDPLLPLLNSLHTSSSQQLAVLIGPEGGLTAQEKELAVQRKFRRHSLGPTVLRAHQAVAIGIGALRATLP